MSPCLVSHTIFVFVKGIYSCLHVKMKCSITNCVIDLFRELNVTFVTKEYCISCVSLHAVQTHCPLQPGPLPMLFNKGQLLPKHCMQQCTMCNRQHKPVLGQWQHVILKQNILPTECLQFITNLP